MEAGHGVCIHKHAFMSPFEERAKVGEEKPCSSLGARFRPVDGVGNVHAGYRGKRLVP